MHTGDRLTTGIKAGSQGPGIKFITMDHYGDNRNTTSQRFMRFVFEKRSIFEICKFYELDVVSSLVLLD